MRNLILGHRGLVGQALTRKLPESTGARVEGYWLETCKNVYLAAAKVGGIGTNVSMPADMIAKNLQIQLHAIEKCTTQNRKLCFFGSSCIYPALNRPIRERDLMAGPLEPTNSPYAIAKIAGVEMCRAYAKQYGLNYVALMPCNLYGPGRLEDTHALPMLMRRIHDAKVTNQRSVTVWGSGEPLREFLYVDDLAEAAAHFMGIDDDLDIVNIGSGEEISICDLAFKIACVVGYKGEFIFDKRKPDGVARKMLDSSKARSLGWRATTSLNDGLRKTYEWLRGVA